MKKMKYRNNNNNYNNQVYSINYKFDSISPAGKCSGTALDLIKRYNELAKEAHGNGNYVEAEVFRQYAEHYRKIVTEINERKNIRFAGKDVETAAEPSENKEDAANTNTAATAEPAPAAESSLVETKPKNTRKKTPAAAAAPAEPETKTVKKAFKVIEISEDSSTPPPPPGGRRSPENRNPQIKKAAGSISNG